MSEVVARNSMPPAAVHRVGRGHASKRAPARATLRTLATSLTAARLFVEDVLRGEGCLVENSRSGRALTL